VLETQPVRRLRHSMINVVVATATVTRRVGWASRLIIL